MELNEFFENFLPDFDAKWETFQKLCIGKIEIKHEATFTMKYFPEAIQNFTDKICEHQRVNCLRVWQINREPHLEGDKIRYAEQPKIDDLLSKK